MILSLSLTVADNWERTLSWTNEEGEKLCRLWWKDMKFGLGEVNHSTEFLWKE